MKIVVDAFGGDNAPVEIVKGAVDAVNKYSDISIILVGNNDRVNEELKKYTYDTSRVETVNSVSVIDCNESPTMAIRTKKDSSLVIGLNQTKERDDVAGFVSAGSTGAVLAGALFIIGRIKGISRPALAPPLPNINGGNNILIDCGANMDSKPEYLNQFAIMGSIYSNRMFGVEKPRVALLNVGTEDEKGNDLCHEAFKLLKDNKKVNFVGNIEARDILFDNADVIVSDGFSGNVALKSTEGTAKFIIKLLKNEIKKAGLFEKFGALLIKKTLKRMLKVVDYDNVGGSVFLGVNKIVVKAHGSSNAKSMLSAIELVRRVHLSGFIDSLKSTLEDINVEE